MINLTFVYAYYNNPKMFELQQKTWASYSVQTQSQLEVIVTDDCSTTPIKPLVDYHIYNLRLFRIQNNIPWNWLQARNIGAKEAQGTWLLLTDIDHVVRPETCDYLMKTLPKLDPEKVYQFGRVLAPDMTHYKFHNDSFLVTKEIFWKCGGYDEDYAGNYGTSGMFRRRLFHAAKDHEYLKKFKLVLYQRALMPDASTTDLKRKEDRDPDVLKRITAWKKENNRGIQLFRQPYTEIL